MPRVVAYAKTWSWVKLWSGVMEWSGVWSGVLKWTQLTCIKIKTNATQTLSKSNITDRRSHSGTCNIKILKFLNSRFETSAFIKESNITFYPSHDFYPRQPIRCPRLHSTQLHSMAPLKSVTLLHVLVYADCTRKWRIKLCSEIKIGCLLRMKITIINKNPFEAL